MAEERERVEVWPAFIVIGAGALLIGVLIAWWQMGVFTAGMSVPRPWLMPFGWLLGVVGWAMLLAGLIGVAVNGYTRPRRRSPSSALSDDDLAALGNLQEWDDRAAALRDLRRRRDAGEISEDDYERARAAVQGE